jgi:antitoxin HigA-1
LPALGLSVTEAANQLSKSGMALARVLLNGRAATSPELAIRLELWLSRVRGGDASAWLSQHWAFDLCLARQVKQPKIKPARSLIET